MRKSKLSYSQDLKSNEGQEQLEFFIQPIRQKVFDFSPKQPTGITHINRLRSYKAKDCHWKPTLNAKKIMDDPKFILSLQRKKARIISAIRDKQNDQYFSQKQVGVMNGSKLKQYEMHRYQYKGTPRQSKNRAEISRIAAENQSKMHRISLKKKKNPYMSFSLNLIKSQTRQRVDSARRSHKNQLETSRQKGSNAVYQYQNLIKTQLLLSQKNQSKCIDDNKTSRTKKRPLTTGNNTRQLNSRQDNRKKDAIKFKTNSFIN